MYQRLWKNAFIGLNGLVLAATLGTASPASAQLIGPKSAAELGILAVDSNPGSAQELGFAGGKSITYSSIDTTGFSAFQWGLAGLGVRLSLDGDFDGTVGETLTYNPALSDPTQGVVVWSGSSPIVNTTSSGNTTVEVETRFRMTVTSIGGGVQVPLNAPGPRVDIFAEALTGFQVRLETLAQRNTLVYLPCVPGTDTVYPDFGPMLEVFDCATDSIQDGQAFTSINTGFFVDGEGAPDDLTSVLDALSVAEAKLDLLGALNIVDLNFVGEDWTKRWVSLGAEFDSVNDTVNNTSSQVLGGVDSLEVKLDSLQFEIGNLPQEIEDRLSDDDEGLSVELLLYLLGFEIPGIPGPEGAPPISDFPMFSALYKSLDNIEAATLALETKADALEAEVDGVRTDLDEVLGSGKVDLEIVQQSPIGDDDESSRHGGPTFVLLSSESGTPVDAAVTDVFAVADTATVEVDWVVTVLRTGLIRLKVELPWALRSARIFLIQVEHAVGPDTVRAGSALASLEPSDD